MFHDMEVLNGTKKTQSNADCLFGENKQTKRKQSVTTVVKLFLCLRI